MPCVIHWFRRDLRLTDNSALNAARDTGHTVVPVYILSSWKGGHRWTGFPRQSFLCGSLESLAKNLEAKGSRLIIREGDAVEELRKLAREVEAEGIFTNRDPDPFGRAVEEKLTAEFGKNFRALADHALHERDEVVKDNGEPYRVFTPYSKVWFRREKAAPGPAIRQLETPPRSLKGLELPTPAHWKLEAPEGFRGHVKPGEKAARERLHAFLKEPVRRYQEWRDFPAAEGTSRLSQDLRWGLVSIRELYAGCEEALRETSGKARESVHTYQTELAWREFYFMVLHHFPEVLEVEFNADYRGLPWTKPAEGGLERWQAGRTGFPIVDAAMRQLNETGFMHNRLRMITAMFLTKDLHVDWREGESYFMQRLVDGEIASNNGGWQWSAGTGADAAPYFRIQNPWTQGRRFDAEGEFIRRYVPELREVPARRLHEPPAEGALARGYPAPMVDHAAERERTLRMYKGHRAPSAGTHSA
jgi:deoxyribodipyrimidine photo-lyase